MTKKERTAWQLAGLALTLLRLDPKGFGGILVKARAGPVRDTFLTALNHLDNPPFRLHPAMPHEALFGGIDLAQTLAKGQIVTTPGLLSQPMTPVLTMAERCPPDRAAELAAWLDETGGPLILLDEGAEPEEAAPPALSERLAFHFNLDSIGRLEARALARSDLTTASQQLTNVITNDVPISSLVVLADRLGISSLRAPLFALRAAKALAAFENSDEIKDNHLETAALLVLAPRATRLPEAPNQEKTEPTEETKDKTRSDAQITPDDILVEAVKAHIPDNILDGLAAPKARRNAGSGAGGKRKSNRRGRPLPSRPGRLGQDARVDLVATLRTAAPWQKLRRRGDGAVKVLPSDIRLCRYEERSERLVIFAVDASGSAAMARLAEAKGAVELLLGEAYANRDHVALIAFRGSEAELLLPPTRSLVQTKRRLAALPGGGGTPLALGLRAAGDLALQSRARGLTPTIALLTDGRANIALDGSANRQAAARDADVMAQWIRAGGFPSVVIDTGNRPEAHLRQLAEVLDARHLALPRADARALGQALRHELGA